MSISLKHESEAHSLTDWPALSTFWNILSHMPTNQRILLTLQNNWHLLGSFTSLSRIRNPRKSSLLTSRGFVQETFSQLVPLLTSTLRTQLISAKPDWKCIHAQIKTNDCSLIVSQRTWLSAKRDTAVFISCSTMEITVNRCLIRFTGLRTSCTFVGGHEKSFLIIDPRLPMWIRPIP